MTDEELQQYSDRKVRVVLGGRALVGTLVTGFRAQLAVKSPYAMQWYDVNETLGTKEERLVAIPSAEAVDSVELVDEDAAAEIEDEAEDEQTPG
jgi:hypothetical protein